MRMYSTAGTQELLLYHITVSGMMKSILEEVSNLTKFPQ